MSTFPGTRKHRVCRFFQAGQNCRYGSHCKFSHDDQSLPPNSQTGPLLAPRPGPYDLTLSERARFRQWQMQTPDIAPLVGLGSGLSAWVKTAEAFVQGDNIELRQQVVETLTSEGGFARIVEIMNAMPATINFSQGQNYLATLAQPLLNVLGHVEVRVSLILEPALDRLHNLMFGTAGQRALQFFTGLVAIFAAAADNINDLIETVTQSLVVLLRIVVLNGSAQVTQGFSDIITNYEEILLQVDPTNTLRTNQATTVLRRIATIMNIGLSLPEVQGAQISDNQAPASFEFARAEPGELRTQGRRHDNDHVHIADIEIMPTKSELEALVNDYLPVNNPRSLHLPGLEGLLDRQFRLLREDTVGQLRDAVRFEMDRLQQRLGQQDGMVREHRGTRVMVYQDVSLDDFIMGRDHLAMLLSFTQPDGSINMSKETRKAYWEQSKSLVEDSLVCLLGSAGFATFFSVCHQPKKAHIPEQYPNKSLYESPVRASTFLKLVEPDSLSFQRLDECFDAAKDQNLILCEFPGVILPAFYHTLNALKTLSQQLDTPFADLLAPASTTQVVTDVEAPDYARRPGFKFDLGCLINDCDTLELDVSKRFDYALLQQHSTLDDGQQRAIVHALTKRFALIQGPPGCGKSFTGVALIKALLANKQKARLGPIICVCYTNHALDQLLEHLVKQGVAQVVRIGAQSKSDILKEVNLKDLSRKIDKTRTERRTGGKLYADLHVKTREIKDTIQSLRDTTQPESIIAHLERYHASHFQQMKHFEHEQLDDDGFQIVDYDSRPSIVKWLHPQPKDLPAGSSTPRDSEDLLLVELTSMSLSERQKLYESWQMEMRTLHKLMLVEHLQQYRKLKKAQQACFKELELRCIAQANVVGLTTSGLAKNLDLLRRSSAKVLVCEEAGEVLEAHMLTALLPSIEHAILIGDHEQLRPQTQNYELQAGSGRGQDFSLDVSLFERLIHPPHSYMPRLPYSTLERQRRMHPSISNLIRQTLYAGLQDDELVRQYPPVVGMADRLFWLDHTSAEAPKGQLSMSCCNKFEVDMVAALVSHLISQCQYRADDIAILTPYLGQLRNLRKKLTGLYDLVVDDRDEAQLRLQGLGDDAEGPAQAPQIARGSVLQMLRLATVDNFQGEEAKVVIISLVRSNNEKKCGFLKSTNRTNVLLSRAKHGMYIIGDSSCYEAHRMWNDVIQLLRADGNLGDTLSLKCPRHPETRILVKTADDFLRFSPEGGCDLPCHGRLPCGHRCRNKCHAKPRHDAVSCPEECRRPHKGCNHLCPKPCGEACGKCEIPMSDVLLPCGHVSMSEKCYISQEPSLAQCKVLVPKVIPECQHTLSLPCHHLVDVSTKCSAPCATMLECGHPCGRDCSECNPPPSKDGLCFVPTKLAPAKPSHECKARCDAQHTICRHQCQQLCHSGTACTPCKQSCPTHCRHSHCSRICSQPCIPCAELCGTGCEHTGICPLPCAVPCDILPCSQRCSLRLSCGCQCPSMCGEPCPDARYCQKCCEPQISEQRADYILLENYGEVDLDLNPCYILSCGHITTKNTLDGIMQMDLYYDINDGEPVALKGASIPFSGKIVTCPDCRHPIQNLHRYKRIWRRAILDESTKKFLAWSTSRFPPLSHSTDKFEIALAENKTLGLETQDGRGRQKEQNASQFMLRGTFDNIIDALRSNSQLASRYKGIFHHSRDIKKYLHDVTEEEQPFGKVYDLMKSARLQGGVSDAVEESVMPAGSNVVLQKKPRLLATSLAFRCNLVILRDFFKLRRSQASVFADKYDWRAVPTSTSFEHVYDAVDILAIEAQEFSYPMIQVEALLHYVHLASLERANSGSTANNPALEQRIEQARLKLDIAKEVCITYPAQTAGMQDDLEAAATCLREETFYQPVSNEEKKQIINAMRQEFDVQGHWYYCPNGHPFTIGECGRAMQQSNCPECGTIIGGGRHTLATGNRAADDVVREFGRMGLGEE